MPRPRKTRAAIPAVATAVALLAGCGGDDESSALAELVPPDSPLYVELAVFPDDGRSEALAALTERIGGIEDPKAELASLVDEQFSSTGVALSWSEDIEPWLGDTAAVFVRSFEASEAATGMVDAAYMSSVKDASAAEGFLDALSEADPDVRFEERTYEDVTYLYGGVDSDTAVGLVDESMVSGTEAAFKAAVDASMGDSLADSEDFSEEVGSLDDENLLEVWLDLGTALDVAAAGATGPGGTGIDAARSALEPLLSEPIAVSLEITEETVALETSAAGGAGIAGNSELLAELPGASWVAVAITDAGTALRESLAGIGSLGAEMGDPRLDPELIAGLIEAQTGLDLEDDLLAWIGNAAFFASGTNESELRVGALLETSDPEASARAVDAVRGAFEQQTGAATTSPKLEGATDGFYAQGPGGAAVELALTEEALVGAFGGPDPASELKDPEEALGDAELYSEAADALGGDFDAALFVAVQDFLVVAEKGDDGDTDYDAARPYTEPLDYLIFGTATDDGRERSRTVLGIGD